MTLLLVDDQINVINGLMNGINYRKLEIDTVLPSTSVQEAKTLICENQIDILMTDIEMPGENGLQLLHWVSENYPDIVCILLTSHADFSYAQYEDYHVGITNLKKRIELIYGTNYYITFYNEPAGGACTLIYLPLEDTI